MLKIFDQNQSAIMWPLMHNVIRKKILNNTFGWVRNEGKKFHAGWDLEASVGTNVFSVADGVVVKVRHDAPRAHVANSYGNKIILKFNFKCKVYYAFYAHLDAVFVREGVAVKKGVLLGTAGKTGNAWNRTDPSEDHLHFEIRESENSGQISPATVFGKCPLREPVSSPVGVYDAAPFPAAIIV